MYCRQLWYNEGKKRGLGRVSSALSYQFHLMNFIGVQAWFKNLIKSISTSLRSDSFFVLISFQSQRDQPIDQFRIGEVLLGFPRSGYMPYFVKPGAVDLVYIYFHRFFFQGKNQPLPALRDQSLLYTWIAIPAGISSAFSSGISAGIHSFDFHHQDILPDNPIKFIPKEGFPLTEAFGSFIAQYRTFDFPAIDRSFDDDFSVVFCSCL